MISEGNVSKNKHDEKQEEEEDGPPKVLRITRTFRLVEFDFFMESFIGIELLNNNSHGLSSSSGFVSFLFDQVGHFASIKLCQTSWMYYPFSH